MEICSIYTGGNSDKGKIDSLSPFRRCCSYDQQHYLTPFFVGDTPTRDGKLTIKEYYFS
jgi:hypothetical protein